MAVALIQRPAIGAIYRSGSARCEVRATSQTETIARRLYPGRNPNAEPDTVDDLVIAEHREFFYHWQQEEATHEEA